MDNIPMRPPKLPGYDFVQMLGSGATATVYLYNQRMPARPVAVKASAKTLDHGPLPCSTARPTSWPSCHPTRTFCR